MSRVTLYHTKPLFAPLIRAFNLFRRAMGPKVKQYLIEQLPLRRTKLLGPHLYIIDHARTNVYNMWSVESFPKHKAMCESSASNCRCRESASAGVLSSFKFTPNIPSKWSQLLPSHTGFEYWRWNWLGIAVHENSLNFPLIHGGLIIVILSAWDHRL